MMKRQEAEKLLAALIFDDLDETSKADLQAYLQTDDELRERLTDMRMAVKVASDTLQQGPEPTLSDQRLKRLAKLARHQRRGPWIIALRRLAVAAALLVVATLLFLPTLSRTRYQSAKQAAVTMARESELREALGDEIQEGGTSTAVARPTLRRRPASVEAVVENAPVERLRGYAAETAGKEVARYGGGVYTGPAQQIADAKKPAPVVEPESVLRYESLDLDSRVVATDSSGSTALTGLRGGTPLQVNGTSLSSLNDSLAIANDLAPKDQPAAPPTSAPVTVSGDSVSSYATYEWRANVTPSDEPVVFDPEAVSETSSMKRNRNERGEELAELSDREVTAFGVDAYAGRRVVELKPTAEAKAERQSSRTDGLDKIEPVKRLTQLSAASGPETDAEKYDADPALPEGARFKVVPVNPWVMTQRDALSTFALDVDTASYTLSRRYIQGGFLPPIGAVRMEEFVNYFDYQYPQRSAPTFAVHAEAAPSPFARRDQNLTLLKIGVKARTLGRDQQKPAHLVFVIDASASMGQPDRLPLVQEALGLLVDKLSPADRVSLITCSREGRLHLETMPASQRDTIRQRIEAIQPAGPTNLLAGLKLGYALAQKAFVPNQINHVVLCSDGVANIGQTEAESILEAVAEDRKQGITLTCIGVGYGTYNDAFLEALANQGDGSYLFLDSPQQARETFVEKFSAALQVVAKDARIQVSFNPQRVRRYRLIGYENRDIEDARFRDDTIDAGEVGSGQCSTALYELELISQPSPDDAGDLGTVYVRYRDVESGQIQEISNRLTDAMVQRPTVEDNPRFFLAAAVARFAEWLRQSEHARDMNLSDVLATVEQISLTLPLDRNVRELVELIRKAEHLPRAP